MHHHNEHVDVLKKPAPTQKPMAIPSGGSPQNIATASQAKELASASNRQKTTFELTDVHLSYDAVIPRQSELMRRNNASVCMVPKAGIIQISELPCPQAS